MDFSYSPTQDPGGTLHLSPTHLHHADSLSAMRRLRRSMSRSPSKVNWISKSSSPSPISPRSPTRANSPLKKTMHTSDSPRLPLPCDENIPSAKKLRPALKRATPSRNTSAASTPARAPMRRALSDSSDNGNASQSPAQSQAPGQENSSSTPEGSPVLPLPSAKDLFLQVPKYEVSALSSPSAAHVRESQHARIARPAKSSPLKRSDGVMNLDRAYLGSPSAKRRSLHGPLSGPVLEPPRGLSEEARRDSLDSDDSDERGASNDAPFRSPLAPRQSSLKRSTSNNKPSDKLGSSRGRRSVDFAPTSPMPSRPGSRSRPRRSLEGHAPGSSPLDRTDVQESQGLSSTPRPVTERLVHTRSTRQQPHPLSKALSPTSPPELVKQDAPQEPFLAFDSPMTPAVNFSKSLPIGALRPSLKVHTAAEAPMQEHVAEPSFATPEVYRIARPDPAAFRSTGLISKRHRNPDDLPPPPAHAGMPDTPCKKFPPGFAFPSSPTPVNTIVKPRFTQPEFGTPSKHANSNPSIDASGKKLNPLGSNYVYGRPNRSDSFASLDGDDTVRSPSGNGGSQSSADELPPTPTKQVSNGPNAKQNSLRSALLGRRASVGPNTFLELEAAEAAEVQPESSFLPPTLSSIASRISPQTPADQAFPDPSSLSISPRHEGPSSPIFKLALGAASNRPPETPTHRDSVGALGFAQPSVTPSNHALAHDVDPVLTSRFSRVTWYTRGEFSDVFRVSLPPEPQSFHSYFGDLPGSKKLQTPGSERVWIVKKSRAPYTSFKMREKQLREVNVMKALRGSDHVVQLIDSWEASGHLYIQTEYCEEGSLHTFLAKTGNKGRLDDFRIWKILIELCLGVKYIHDSGFMHLDLKPANVFIDFGGYLKIGDFGLACEWPAPRDIEGEGDRRYIGPDLLQGYFDKPADVFALGMMMFEIAGNCILPDYGASWQKLRSGDFSGLPSLTSGSTNSVFRGSDDDASHGRPADDANADADADIPDVASYESFFKPDAAHGRFSPGLRTWSPDFAGGSAQRHGKDELAAPPDFMRDPAHGEALDRVVHWMMAPSPEDRPAVDQILQCHGVVWVGERRRSGAVVYEGDWGPPNHVLMHGVQEDEEMLDVP